MTSGRPAGSTTTVGYRGRGVPALVALAALLVTLRPTAVGAHVTVTPPRVEGGGFATFAFEVPNERDDAGTVAVEIVFPDRHPVTAVLTEPVPGWTVSVERRPSPDGTREVIDRITWRGGPIPPGGFQRFAVAAGPLPDRGRLVFAALQTYADGEVVRWIEPVPRGGPEPDFPAPELRLGAPPAAQARPPVAVASGDGVARALSAAALGVGLVALAVAGRAGRRRRSA